MLEHMILVQNWENTCQYLDTTSLIILSDKKYMDQIFLFPQGLTVLEWNPNLYSSEIAVIGLPYFEA
jgi:hypothetical protein